MFCLRSWLPLLFIPTNASPIFIFLFFACTYFLNRPCVYCSFLLLILFASSCNWADQCFFDFSSNWFEARPLPELLGCDGNLTCQAFNNTSIPGNTFEQAVMMAGSMNSTAKTLGGVVFQELQRRLPDRTEWTGIGVGWLRSLLGRREWTLPCVDVNVRL
ncbi:hypothetical protein VC83_00767 [Pseudogymnoascus destructans]|uniref:Uncharacterized protein n=2 Tax=Pseudogymnoascus destructans TaxID=655981 RepID=L8G6Q8_PSED2|nr:uncharacterized protein VC83_00767 [Pseudogymnoascus destructans]ELR08797.1 hypothetical protein GMDG_03473 [Pseudogymnoascus destructans 20631-21]OAF62675.2 hypothetical protein VC83_00767 [Pseudogymnoascus destructans]